MFIILHLNILEDNIIFKREVPAYNCRILRKNIMLISTL